MGNFNYIQNNFTSGQLSPLLADRSDFKKHKSGLKTLKNMTILPQGGVTSRTGSKYISELKTSSTKSRLIPFEFSTTQTYVIEVGNGYMRFYKETGQILESDIDNISGLTQANPGVVTRVGHGLSNGDHVYITEVEGMTEVNNSRQVYIVANKTADTFELTDRDGNNVDTSGFTAYSSGGVINKVYEISSPYSESDLFDIQFTQSADVITLVHPNYAPRNLTRTGDTSWALTALMKDGNSPSATLAITDGPYLAENTESTTFTPSATSGSVTITANATTGINGGDGFKNTDVGRLIRFQDSGSTWHYMEITAFTSTTVVTATIVDTTLANTNARSTWRLGSWSQTTGFPKTIVYHQLRKVYAGTTDQPDTVWGSAVDDFNNFTPGTDDDEAFNFTLASNRVNAIYWMTSADRLRIGTEGGIWSLYSGDTDISITPTSVEAEQENHIRCKDLQAQSLGNVTLFTERSGKKVRELVFNFETDGLVEPDLTIMSEDILGDWGDTSDTGIIQTTFQQEPIPTLWCALSNGKVAGMTYLRDQDIVGWHIHEFGGTSTQVESITAVPSTGEDEVYVVVKRTINSTTRRYVEKLDNTFRGKDVSDGIFIDSATEHTLSSTDSVTGLDHLEGETVTILTDGGSHPTRTVSSGSITLDDTVYTNVKVGVGYTREIETLDIDFGSSVGTAYGSKGKVNEIVLNVFESSTGSIGYDSSKLDSIIYREGNDPVGEGVEAFTGEIKVRPRGGQRDSVKTLIRTTEALPFTLLSLIIKGQVDDSTG